MTFIKNNYLKTFISVVIVFFCLMNFTTVRAEQSVRINSTNFPDSVFREYLSDKFDEDGDGMLDEYEIESIVGISIDGNESENKIHSLKGIEYFSELQELFIYNEEIKTLDIAKNHNLRSFGCYDCKLTSIDVSQNIELESLACVNNELAVLDVSENKNLEKLDCSRNMLTSLDVSQNIKLTDLNCQENRLTTLSLLKNINLIMVFCGYNELTDLYVPALELECIDCEYNNIKELSVKGQPSINSSGNRMAYIQGTGGPYSENECEDMWVDIVFPANNTLSEDLLGKAFDMGCVKNIQGASVSGKYMVWDGVSEEITYDYMPGKYSLGKFTIHPQRESQICLDQWHFPDACFREYLEKYFDMDENGILDAGEINDITEIDCSNMGIKSLRGVEYLTNLTSLDCSENLLEKLILKDNKKIQRLYFQRNNIFRIETWKNRELIEVDCSENVLDCIDLTGNKKLKKLVCRKAMTEMKEPENLEMLDCAYNPTYSSEWADYYPTYRYLDCTGCGLRSLYLNRARYLETLYCDDNCLETIDVSECKNLKTLSCEGNVYMLDDTQSKEFTDWNDMDEEIMDNRITDVTGAYYENGVLTWDGISEEITYTYKAGETWEVTLCAIPMDTMERVKIDSTNFPDIAFRTYVSEYVDYDKNNVLDAEEIYSKRWISCKNGCYVDVSNAKQLKKSGPIGELIKIKSLQGIEYFTNLQWLDCRNNQIAGVDLKKCEKLLCVRMQNNVWTGVFSKERMMNTESITGFNANKVGDISGAEIIGNRLLWDGMTKPIVYSYDMGNGFAGYFSINPIIGDKTDIIPTQRPVSTPTRKPQSKSTIRLGQIMQTPSGKLTLVVVSVGNAPEVCVKKVRSKGVKKVKIPKVVKIRGIVYNVTSIAPKAFAGCKKLKRITIGENVRSIGKNAFRNCKRLKTVFVKSRVLQKVGKNAFKGTNHKLKVRFPKGLLKMQRKKYKKMFRSKGNKKVIYR